MSAADDFHNGNTLFQAFMNETRDPADPGAHLKNSLELANIGFPSTQESAKGVAKKSISHMKQKAELLSKALGEKFKRTECLNLAANMCFFSSWKAYLSFTESFHLLSEGQRKSSGDTVKLIASLWNITENRENDFFNKFIVASAMILSIKTGTKIQESAVAAKKVFTDSKAKSTGDYIDEREILEIIHNLHQEPGKYYLMTCLSHAPTRKGIAVKWGNLENVDVGFFLQKTIFFDTGNRIVEMPVVEAIAASIMAAIHSYAEANLPLFVKVMFSPDLISSEKNRLIDGLARDKTREEVYKVILKLFQGRLTDSVNGYITRQVGTSGFIDGSFFSQYREDKPPAGLIPGSERKLENGHLVKLYKTANFKSNSYSGVSLHQITALAFDTSGFVSGYLVVNHIINPSCTLKTLGLFCDEIENAACIEAAVSLGMTGGFKSKVTISHPAIITHWEVSRDYQSMGIGKSLINHAFDFNPVDAHHIDYVLAKVEPLEYPIPPIDDTEQTLIPNYYSSKSRVLSIWNKVTNNGSVFGNRSVPFHSVGYQKNCHGHPNLLMTAMTLFEFGS
ncbi:hypothetical protein V0M98_36760 (plasmid) [Pseudomonas silesiensis]|uniref:hypothetical protein n=1 Tax=Pseudomonas silesiensis TaxID=1853130 RepID=UPI0030CC137A